MAVDQTQYTVEGMQARLERIANERAASAQALAEREGVQERFVTNAMNGAKDAKAELDAYKAMSPDAKTAYIDQIRQNDERMGVGAAALGDAPAPQVARTTPEAAPARADEGKQQAVKDNLDGQLDVREQMLGILEQQLKNAQVREDFIAAYDAAPDKKAFVRKEGPKYGIDPQEMEAIFAQQAARPRVQLPDAVPEAGSTPLSPAGERKQLEFAVQQAQEGMAYYKPGMSSYDMHARQLEDAQEKLAAHDREHGTPKAPAVASAAAPEAQQTGDFQSHSTPQTPAPAPKQPQQQVAAAPAPKPKADAPAAAPADPNSRAGLYARYQDLVKADSTFEHSDDAAGIRMAYNSGDPKALEYARIRIGDAEKEVFGEYRDGVDRTVHTASAEQTTVTTHSAASASPAPAPKPAQQAADPLKRDIATIASGGNASITKELGLNDAQARALQTALINNGHGMEPYGADGHVGKMTLEAYHEVTKGENAKPFAELNQQELTALAQNAAQTAKNPEKLVALGNAPVQTAQDGQDQNTGIAYVQDGDTPDGQAAQAQREADVTKAESKEKPGLDMEKAMAALKKGFDGSDKKTTGPGQSNLESQIEGGEFVTDEEAVEQEFDQASREAGELAAQRQAELQAAMQGFDLAALKGGKVHIDATEPTGRVVTENMAEAEAAKAEQTGGIV